MSYVITKRFRFSASHRLERLPPEHKCHRLHGHNYEVVIELAAPDLTDQGFVVDYGRLDGLIATARQLFDHRHLNDVLKEDEPATAETLARVIYDLAASVDAYGYLVTAVTVCETPDTTATYRAARG